MSAKATANAAALFSDLFKPWNEWFPIGDNPWNNMLSMPTAFFFNPIYYDRAKPLAGPLQ